MSDPVVAPEPPKLYVTCACGAEVYSGLSMVLKPNDQISNLHCRCQSCGARVTAQKADLHPLPGPSRKRWWRHD